MEVEDESDIIDIFAKPECLIDTDDSGKFIVREKVLSQLRRLHDREIVVVAIVGRYRTGKSYLMNRLFGHVTGFPLGSTVQAKTKGIWAWIKVHPVYPEKYLLLLDTEGLGDVETADEKHDDDICVLATLMSSTLVFNNIGIIDYDSLLKLHFVSNLVKLIYSRTEKNLVNDRPQQTDKDTDENNDVDEDDYENSANFNSNICFKFPDFIYAIRDFCLDLEINGQTHSPDEYLEKQLSVYSPELQKPAVQNCKRIKHCLRRLFPRRKCFTFVAPVAGNKMKFLDTMKDEDLEKEFIKNTEVFINHVLNTSCSKIINGVPLTGKELSSLVVEFVQQINRGGSLRVVDIIDNIRSMTNTEAKESALRMYTNGVIKGINLPTAWSELTRIHGTALQEALKLFKSKAIFLDGDENFETDLTEEINKLFSEFANNNERERIKLCEEVLQQLCDDISYKVQDGTYSRKGGCAEFMKEMKKVEIEYKNILGSLAAEDILLQFQEKNSLIESILSKAEAEARIAEELAAVEQMRAFTAKREKEAAEREKRLRAEIMQQQQQAHRQIVEQLSRVAYDQQQQIRRNYEELEKHRLDEQRRLAAEGFSREASRMRAEIEALQKRL